jgi:calcineurin-like phosphoesterase family protein
VVVVYKKCPKVVISGGKDLNYFISDLHLGHANSIKLCGRPFVNVEEMDETIIKNWNDRVKKGDTVYIVGDLIWQSCDPTPYLERLKGHKILIIGNHDEKWLKKYDCANYFDLIAPYLETRIDNHPITLCHYPMVEWKASRKLGSVKKLGFHIYGHIHNSYKPLYRELFLCPHAYNASADINNFTPVTFDELAKNNEVHKLKVLPNLIDKAEFIAGEYHMYQTDKVGKPYIEHPRAVAAQLTGESEKVVALLHDTLEDTTVDKNFLIDIFGEDIVAVVEILTRKGEDYFDYIKNVAKNQIATMVKIADLKHNMDLSRIPNPTEQDFARNQKYQK